jgi:glycosyltransferase involved in cell wall biosynthesis
MKILVVANLYPNESKPYWGTFVRECYLGYLENGIDAELSVIKKSGVLGYLIFYTKTIFKILFGSYDVVHVHYVSHSVLPVLVAKVFKRFRLVLNFHGSDAFSELGEKRWKVFLKESLNKIAIRVSSLVVVPSEYFRREMESRYPGVRSSFVSPSGGVRAGVFEYKIGENNSVLFVGRMITEKGALTAAQIVRQLNKYIRKSCFIGNGPDRMDVQKTVGGIDVDFLNLVSQQRLGELMSDYDIFLFPSIRKGESLGLVVVEAIFCGMIPVVLNNGAVSEVIPPELHNLLIANDVSQFQSNLEKILSLDVSEKEEIKRVLYQYGINKYSHDLVSRDLSERMLSLLKGASYV